MDKFSTLCAQVSKLGLMPLVVWEITGGASEDVRHRVKSWARLVSSRSWSRHLILLSLQGLYTLLSICIQSYNPRMILNRIPPVAACPLHLVGDRLMTWTDRDGIG